MTVLVLTTSTRRSWAAPLLASLTRFHPDERIVLVDCDVIGRVGLHPFGSVDVAGLPPDGIDGVRTADLAMALGDRDAGWAALPAILQSVDVDVSAGRTVVVLADTVRLLGPVAELFSAARPLVRAARVDGASGIASGGGLPGAIAVPHDCGSLLGWWDVRAGVVARSQSATGMDELWRDLPIGTEVDAARDPALRLHVRTLDQIALDGPLRLVDVDHLDPERPWWWTEGGKEPLVRVSASPDLRRLVHRFADEVLDAGWSTDEDRRSTLVPVTPALRNWYRRGLATGAALPNPLVRDEVAAFLDALTGPGDRDGCGISLAADLVLQDRPDVAAAFPSARWADRDAFIGWLWTHGVRERAIAPAVLPPRPTRVRTRRRRPRRGGVNLVGYLDGDLGLGVAARHLRTALEGAGVEVASVSYDRTSSRRADRDAAPVLEAPFATNLLMITPDQLPYFVADVGADFLAGRHNIGLWYWETDVLTERQLSSFGHVDEVWASTSYLADVFASYDRVPVSLVPVPLEFDDPGVVPSDRARLGLDERFTVLFSFDFLSVMERKNPIGLVEAFTRAFGPDDGARLILKSINGDVFPEQKERVLDAIGERSDIELWDRYLDARDRLALVAVADCYASLHRSEGLGLTMAEAMSVGTPVVATAYSGNLDFMDDSDALLVPADVVEVGPGQFYPADGHWAAPDLDAAADALRRLAADPELGRSLVAAAATSLDAFRTDRVGMIATARLRELGLVG